MRFTHLMRYAVGFAVYCARIFTAGMMYGLKRLGTVNIHFSISVRINYSIKVVMLKFVKEIRDQGCSECLAPFQTKIVQEAVNIR